MWSTLIYRMRAKTPGEVIAAIERNAEHIRRPNSTHSYSHLVLQIVRFEGTKRIIGHRESWFDPRPEGFWHEWKSEEDVLAAVHATRRAHLFGPPNPSPQTPLQILLTELDTRYANVHDREAERALLREGESRLPEADPTGHFRKNGLRVWKYMKRHTSPISFPFIRPGIDIYKADGFDLHGDPAFPRWYAVVQFHY